MALDLDHFVQTNRAEIVLTDGSTTPVELTIDADGADFAISGFAPGAGSHTIEKVISRGRLKGLVEGDPMFPTWSLTALLAELTSTTVDNVIDFVRRTGKFSSNKSTLGDGHPYTITVIFRHTNDLGDVDEWVLEDNLVSISSFNEGRPASVSLDGECLGTHTRTHTPAVP